MVKCGNELMPLVADVTGLLSNRQRLHWKLCLFFVLAFIGIKNLLKSQDRPFNTRENTAENPEDNIKTQLCSADTDLEYSGNLFGIGAVHVGLSDRPHMEEFAVGRE